MKRSNDSECLADIAILNFWKGANFGGTLTAYALQQFLTQSGYSSHLLNYKGDSQYFERDCHFARFAKNELVTSPYIATRAQLDETNHQYANFIVGSDQVWRGCCNWGSHYVYYLDFVAEANRKIACAASFGKDCIDRLPHVTKNMAALVSRFDAISVREADGVDVCKRELNCDATHVLDPVFYLDSAQWSSLADKSTRCLPERYAAHYMLDSKELEDKDLGLPLVDAAAEKEAKVDLYSWIRAIRDAEYLITDSFHGLCFALIFNKPLLVVVNVHRGPSRFTSILNALHLGDRLVDNLDDMRQDLLRTAPLNEDNRVILNQQIRFAQEFLIQALKAPLKAEVLDCDALRKADQKWHKSINYYANLAKSVLGFYLDPRDMKWKYREMYQDLRTWIGR